MPMQLLQGIDIVGSLGFEVQAHDGSQSAGDGRVEGDALRLTDRLVDEFRAGTHFSPEAKATEPAKAEDQPKAAA